MSKTTSKTSPSLEKREQYQKKSQDTKPQYPTSPGQAQYRRQGSHQGQPRITGKSNNQQILLRRSKQSSQPRDRKSTRLNSSHLGISYAVFCLKKKKNT